MEIVLFILSVIISGAICKVLNKNTIGTVGAYVKRYIVVWLITAILLFSFFG